jgi:hypothetical protein
VLPTLHADVVGIDGLELLELAPLELEPRPPGQMQTGGCGVSGQLMTTHVQQQQKDCVVVAGGGG